MPRYDISVTIRLDALTPEEAHLATKRLLGTIPRYAGFGGTLVIVVGDVKEYLDARPESNPQPERGHLSALRRTD